MSKGAPYGRTDEIMGAREMREKERRTKASTRSRGERDNVKKTRRRREEKESRRSRRNGRREGRAKRRREVASSRSAFLISKEQRHLQTTPTVFFSDTIILSLFCSCLPVELTAIKKTANFLSSQLFESGYFLLFPIV